MSCYLLSKAGSFRPNSPILGTALFTPEEVFAHSGLRQRRVRLDAYAQVLITSTVVAQLVNFEESHIEQLPSQIHF
jgi:hypothetical protein